MRIIYRAIFGFLLLNTLTYAAAVPTNQPTDQPTPNADPLPTVQETNPDVVMTEKAQLSIKSNKFLDGQHISAASKDGVVTIQGTVDTKEQEQAAIDTVRNLPGIKNVESQLTVKATADKQ